MGNVGLPNFSSGENNRIVSSDFAFDSAISSIIFIAIHIIIRRCYEFTQRLGVFGNSNITIGRMQSYISFDSDNVTYISFSDASDSSNKVKVMKVGR